MPCHPARARELLRKKRAAVWRLKPFTIILKDRVGGDTQATELKYDAGSKVTGIALVVHGAQGAKVAWAAHLHHRGQAIRDALLSRRGIRRSRRHRKTRYRAPRFLNRTRPEGWLAPSLQSRVDNIASWTKKLIRLTPITNLTSELVRFDMQKLRNPEIDGVAYQRGTTWSSSKGGSDSVTNLVLACRPCNEKKANRSIEVFLAKKPELLKKISQQLKSPLKDAAAINTIRYAIGERLKTFGLPIGFGTGGHTKFNRTSQGYDKDHWIDAICVGQSGSHVIIPRGMQPLVMKAMGRGTRQMCRVDRYGFPRTSAKQSKIVKGFATGDWVKAVVTKGKKIGTYIGRVAVRRSGSFNIKTDQTTVEGISWRHCAMLQKGDGYAYF